MTGTTTDLDDYVYEAAEQRTSGADRDAGLPGSPDRRGWAMTEKAKILLVDDRQENLLALEAILSALDQTLVRAHSGEEALKALLTDEFAVILLDVQMPGMDGFETAAHIKRREKTRDIPIIFLTAINHGPHHTFRGYAAGAVDYISKPFDPWVLRAKVAVFVDLYKKNCQLREQAALLRGRLDAGENRAGDVLGELFTRLAALEEGADGMAKQLEAHEDATLVASANQVLSRVARLRSALDALVPAPAGHGGPPERPPAPPAARRAPDAS